IIYTLSLHDALPIFKQVDVGTATNYTFTLNCEGEKYKSNNTFNPPPLNPEVPPWMTETKHHRAPESKPTPVQPQKPISRTNSPSDRKSTRLNSSHLG